MSAPFRPDLPHIPGNYPGRGGGGPVYPAAFPDHGDPASFRPPMGTPIVWPWWYIEMPGSLDWELNALNQVATASSTTAVSNFSLSVPVANYSVLTYLSLTVLNPTTSLNFKIELNVNGGPVPGWSNIYIPPLNATAYQLIFNQMVIRMDEGNTLTAKVTEASGTAFTYTLQARGWHTPKLVVDSFRGEVKY